MSEDQLVKSEVNPSLFLTPVMNISLAKSRLSDFQEFISDYLKESKDGGEDGGDYGIIPGTKKKTLLKSGAEKLCEVYGLYDDYLIESKVEDFNSGLFYYQIKCILKSRRDNSPFGTGLGSCSSYESKYRWRDSQRKCPICGAPAIIKGKTEYVKKDGSGYWLCFAKKGGCGKTFKQGYQDIEAQILGRIENPDIVDIANTVLKMGKKRAKIDAVISVTRSSGIFSQDLDELSPTPSQSSQPSRQDSPGSNDDPFVDGKVVEPTQAAEPVKQTAKKAKKEVVAAPTQENQFENSYHFEIAKKQKIANEALLLPCFDHDRDKLYARVNRTDHTLESITKAVTWIKDQAEIRAKLQKDIDKANGIEIKESDLPLLKNIESATEAF